MNKYVRVLVVYGIPNLHTDHLITYLLTCAYLLYPQSTAFMVARRVTEEWWFVEAGTDCGAAREKLDHSTQGGTNMLYEIVVHANVQKTTYTYIT